MLVLSIFTIPLIYLTNAADVSITSCIWSCKSIPVCEYALQSCSPSNHIISYAVFNSLNIGLPVVAINSSGEIKLFLPTLFSTCATADIITGCLAYFQIKYGVFFLVS